MSKLSVHFSSIELCGKLHSVGAAALEMEQQCPGFELGIGELPLKRREKQEILLELRTKNGKKLGSFH